MVLGFFNKTFANNLILQNAFFLFLHSLFQNQRLVHNILNTLSKNILTFISFLGLSLFCLSVQGQITDSDSTSTLIQKDSINFSSDTLQVNDSIPADSVQGDIETTVLYYADDSIRTNLIQNVAYLYGNAKVVYGEITLTADEIQIDWDNDLVRAYGRPDSTGKIQNKPLFQQGADSYVADSISYNMETEKGVVHGIITEQGGGYLTADKVKRYPEGYMYLNRGSFTTCNLAEPHFHIQARKLKLLSNNTIVAGPFNMYVGDAPTPLGFLFGMFPNSTTRRSGIIVPVYGESLERGFFLRNGGYYWAIGERAALTFLGDIYTRGSWRLEVNGQYQKKYYYRGNASIRYSNLIDGEDTEKVTTREFWVEWAHSPVPRGPGLFTANVRFGTTSFNANNSFSTQDFLSNQFNSSISYTRRLGTLFNLNISARGQVNAATNIIDVTLPQFNLSMNRVSPFKPKNRPAKNWIHRIGITYQVNGSYNLTNNISGTGFPSFPFTIANSEAKSIGNIISTTNSQTGVTETTPTAETPDFFDDFDLVLENARLAITHSVGIQTSMKLFKYFSLNPSISYQEFWYPFSYAYVPETDNPLSDDAIPVNVVRINQFDRAYSASFSTSLNTNVYGFFRFKNSKREAQIRHLMQPSITFSYTPDFSQPFFGFYQEVPVAVDGSDNNIVTRTERVSRFQGLPSGQPSANETGSIGFSVNNSIEMKKRGKTDSDSAFQKIPILENLSISGSYNLTATEFNLSNITINARTRLLDIFDINFGAIFDPYAFEKDTLIVDGDIITPRRINILAIDKGQGLARLISYNLSVGSRFTPQGFKDLIKKKENKLKELGEVNPRFQDFQNNAEQYVDFEIPWSLGINYILNWSRSGFQNPTVTQSLSFNGDLSITKTWKIGFSSGYDLVNNEITFTNINIYKDLHCWEMSLNWIPFGVRQSYTFDLRVKASILQDLKLSRNRSWIDR